MVRPHSLICAVAILMLSLVPLQLDTKADADDVGSALHHNSISKEKAIPPHEFEAHCWSREQVFRNF